MPVIDLVFDSDCPHIEPSRQHLRAAFASLGIPGDWNEWDRADPATPDGLRGFGSPTILVNGEDVAGEQPGPAVPCCRLYSVEGERASGVPSLDMIVLALTKRV
jgi:mercuric ion transport protein